MEIKVVVSVSEDTQTFARELVDDLLSAVLVAKGFIKDLKESNDEEEELVEPKKVAEKAKQVKQSKKTAVPEEKVVEEDEEETNEEEIEEETVPAKKTKSDITIEEVRTVLAKASKAGKDVKSLLAKYNAKTLSEVDPKFYEELIKKVKTL